MFSSHKVQSKAASTSEECDCESHRLLLQELIEREHISEPIYQLGHGFEFIGRIVVMYGRWNVQR